MPLVFDTLELATPPPLVFSQASRQIPVSATPNQARNASNTRLSLSGAIAC